MVLKLRDDYLIRTSEFLAAIWAERHTNFYSLDCLTFVLKIMVNFKVLLSRHPVQVEIDIRAIFFKPCLCE